MEIDIPSKAFIRIYVLYDDYYDDKKIYVFKPKFKNIFESVIESFRKNDIVVFNDIETDKKNRVMDCYDEHRFSSVIMNYIGDDIEKFKIKMKLAL